MDRKRQTLNMLQMAVVGLLVAASCTGCGKPMLYHFKHYQRPFAAISKSNKTYFHSSQTGKIIEKDPCARYCEPGCYGYEETCWTRWPDECKGTCPPLQDEPVEQYGMPMPYEGQIISNGEMMMDQSVVPPNPVYQQAPVEVPAAPATTVPDVPSAPVPDAETRLPSLRVPSLPADVESAVPSPSDATMLPRTEPIRKAPRAIHNETITPPTPSMAQLPPIKEQAPTLVPLKEGQSRSLLNPSRDSKVVEQELTPLPATKVAQLPEKVQPVLKNAAKPSGLSDAKVSGPVASSRKAKTLREKLRVRAKQPAKRVVTDTAAVKLPKAQPTPARLQLGGDNVSIQIVEKVQPKKNLNTAQVVLPKTNDTEQSVVRFSNTNLASKLKNAKPAIVNRVKATKSTAAKPAVTKPHAAVKVQPKPASPAKLSDKSVVKLKSPKTPKATLNVSTGESSFVRFATSKASKEVSRLSAPHGSTVLRFAD